MLPAKIKQQKELLKKSLKSLEIYESLEEWQKEFPNDTALLRMKDEEIRNYASAITDLASLLSQQTKLKSTVELAENFYI